PDIDNKEARDIGQKIDTLATRIVIFIFTYMDNVYNKRRHENIIKSFLGEAHANLEFTIVYHCVSIFSFKLYMLHSDRVHMTATRQGVNYEEPYLHNELEHIISQNSNRLMIFISQILFLLDEAQVIKKIIFLLELWQGIIGIIKRTSALISKQSQVKKEGDNNKNQFFQTHVGVGDIAIYYKHKT
ncbi:hypothetical protein ACJX0J_033899, partial [Zea mays]